MPELPFVECSDMENSNPIGIIQSLHSMRLPYD